MAGHLGRGVGVAASRRSETRAPDGHGEHCGCWPCRTLANDTARSWHLKQAAVGARKAAQAERDALEPVIASGLPRPIAAEYLWGYELYQLERLYQHGASVSEMQRQERERLDRERAVRMAAMDPNGPRRFSNGVPVARVSDATMG